jgi:hypothetical protein
MQQNTAGLTPIADAKQRDIYSKLLSEELGSSGTKGRLLFCVSTVDLNAGKGDLFVALGLARHLHSAGWQVTFWPAERWGTPTPDNVDIAIVMVESFVPGLVSQRTKLVAWVRNWTEKWSNLPYLDRFDAVWCSSSASADRITQSYQGRVQVVPIGVDLELFKDTSSGTRPAEVVATANFWGQPRDIHDAAEQLAVSVDVHWFGANTNQLQANAGIVDHGLVDFFAMPSVYSQSKLVLDDLIPSAKQFGTQNSRLYEALACGALPITNCRLGLDELGLGAVPTYSSSSELVQLVQALQRDEPRRRSLVNQLSMTVGTMHSYAKRAETVDAILREELPLPVRRQGSETEILAFATVVTEDLRERQKTADREHTELLATHESLRLQVEHSQRLDRTIEALRNEISSIRNSRSYRLAGAFGRTFRKLTGRA